MPERLSISEAPKATLGQAGVDQNIPMAERTTEGEVTAKRTTIADMANFFGGGGGGIQPQIIQFEANPTATGDLSINRNLPAGSLSTLLNIKFDSSTVNVIAGSPDFYAVGNNTVIFAESGAYRFTIAPRVDYTPAAATGGYRYTGFIRTGINNQNITLAGNYIRPFGQAPARTFTVSNLVIILEVLVRAAPWRCDFGMLNSGNAATPFTQDVFRIQGETGNTQPAFTIEYLGPLAVERQKRAQK